MIATRGMMSMAAVAMAASFSRGMVLPTTPRRSEITYSWENFRMVVDKLRNSGVATTFRKLALLTGIPRTKLMKLYEAPNKGNTEPEWLAVKKLALSHFLIINHGEQAAPEVIWETLWERGCEDGLMKWDNPYSTRPMTFESEVALAGKKIRNSSLAGVWFKGDKRV